jgi:type IV secretion system protein TrbI
MANAFDSPDSVQLKGKVKGVTRLSRRAKLFIYMLLGFAAAIILFSILSVDEDSSAPTADHVGEAEEKKDPDAPKPVAIPATPNFDKIGDGQAALAVQLGATPNDPAAPPQSTGGAGGGQAGQNIGPGYEVGDGKMPKLSDKAMQQGGANLSGQAGAGAQSQAGTQSSGAPAQVTQKEIDKANRDRDIAERKKQAVYASLDAFSGDGGGGAPAAQNPVAALAALAGQQEAMMKTAAAAQGGVPQGFSMPAFGGAGGGQEDQNKQARKEQFLKTAGDGAGKNQLPHNLQLAQSPYEIKEGWAIPAQLQCGINSDLPGQFCGRITENVYDSATGKHLLIPQHTTFTGTYDSQIAYGQERILAVITRLVFPDGSSLDLGGMPGSDKAGNAGFDADVNNHYMKVFGSAAFMATFSAAVSLTQKQSSAVNGQQTNSQVITQSLGQQLGQTGAAFIQRGMNVQPTLKRDPGYRFNIRVTKDITLPGPYKRRDARAP